MASKSISLKRSACIGWFGPTHPGAASVYPAHVLSFLVATLWSYGRSLGHSVAHSQNITPLLIIYFYVGYLPWRIVVQSEVPNASIGILLIISIGIQSVQSLIKILCQLHHFYVQWITINLILCVVAFVDSSHLYTPLSTLLCHPSLLPKNQNQLPPLLLLTTLSWLPPLPPQGVPDKTQNMYCSIYIF